MDKKDDSVLFLLQDIKELVFGIALILLGGILLYASILDSGAVELFALLGLPVLAYGVFHIWNGWTNHKPVEKNGEGKKKEEQGGPHAL